MTGSPVYSGKTARARRRVIRGCPSKYSAHPQIYVSDGAIYICRVALALDVSILMIRVAIEDLPWICVDFSRVSRWRGNVTSKMDAKMMSDVRCTN